MVRVLDFWSSSLGNDVVFFGKKQLSQCLSSRNAIKAAHLEESQSPKYEI